MADVKITKLSENVSIVSKLDDRPNLDADELKAEFDKGNEIEKNYINNTLIPDIEKGFRETENSIQDINSSYLFYCFLVYHNVFFKTRGKKGSDPFFPLLHFILQMFLFLLLFYL